MTIAPSINDSAGPNAKLGNHDVLNYGPQVGSRKSGKNSTAGQNIEQLKVKANEAFAHSVEAASDAVKFAIECGQHLNTIKAALPHGTFGDWIESNFNGNIRTAQRFMKAARHPDRIKDASNVSEVYGLLTNPKTPDKSNTTGLSLLNKPAAKPAEGPRSSNQPVDSDSQNAAEERPSRPAKRQRLLHEAQEALGNTVQPIRRLRDACNVSRAEYERVLELCREVDTALYYWFKQNEPGDQRKQSQLKPRDADSPENAGYSEIPF